MAKPEDTDLEAASVSAHSSDSDEYSDSSDSESDSDAATYEASIQSDFDTVIHTEAELEAVKQKLAKTFKRLNRKGTDRLVTDIVTRQLQHGLERFYKRITDLKTLPHLEIRAHNLTYTVKAKTQHNRSVTLWSVVRDAFVSPLAKNKDKDRDILHDINLCMKPGELTLVLGSPGCGKTSFLKALSGKLVLDSNRRTSGRILYNDQDIKDMRHEHIAAYISQVDTHLPTLTVKETLEFAALNKVSTHPRLHGDNIPEEIEYQMKLFSYVLLQLLGLDRCADTVVGDNLVRGVSGGERKRVTTGEVLASTSMAVFADEISTGLDSAATYDIIKMLGTWARSFDTIACVALLQPPPEVYNLFDRIIVLAGGRIIYDGARERVLDYFQGLGFECPLHVDVADFLQEVATQDGINYVDAAVSVRDVPRTPIEFELAFKKSQGYHDALDAAYQKPPKDTINQFHNGYFTREFLPLYWESFLAVLWRQQTLLIRNVPLVAARIGQAIIMGVFAGSLFYQLDTDKFQTKLGLLFFAPIFQCMGGLASLPNLLSERAVFYKQRGQNFFPTSTWILAANLVHLPMAILEVTLFTAITYYLSGLATDNNGEFYGKFWLVVFLTNVVFVNFFRGLASVIPSEASAQSIAGGSLLMFILFCGYLIPRDQLPSGWMWMYWLSPLQYAISALAVNEFRSPTYNVVWTKDPIQLTGAPARMKGVAYMEIFGFETDEGRYWVGVAALVGFAIFFAFLSWLCLERVRFNHIDFVAVDDYPSDDENDGDSDGRASDEEARGGSYDRCEVPHTAKSDLAFEPCTLSFHELSYAVDVPSVDGVEKRYLLHQVSGYAKPGEMTALMGSSGAGKSTLLDVIAGRKTGGYTEGDILINGHPKDNDSFQRVSGYVEQTDIHCPTMTVREAFMFSAQLRLDPSITAEERESYVQNVIELLEMDDIADRVIGHKDSGGLSVEQAKRTTIGVELVSNPSILCLDEPTSGLDSRAALVVMRVIKNIVATGRTVVCTIHQPSYELFRHFDRLLLMQRGGRVVYFGDLGDDSTNLIDYFHAIPDTKTIREHENPATYMLEVIGAGVGKTVDVDYTTKYLDSELSRTNILELDRLRDSSARGSKVEFKSVFAANQWTQFVALMDRVTRSYWRSPSYNLVRFGVYLGLALLFGSVYWDINSTDQPGMFSAVAAMFMTTTFVGIINMTTIVPFMMDERAVFYRERASNTYSPYIYNVVIGLVEIPYILLSALLFVSVFYYMVGFNPTPERLFMYYLCFTAYSALSTYLGQLIAVLSPSAEVAGIVGPGITAMWTLFAGFMIPEPDIPVWYIWMHWLAAPKYLIESMAVSQFDCDGGVDAGCTTMTKAFAGEATKTQIEFLNDQFGFVRDRVWMDIGVLIAFTVVFRVCTFYALKYVNHLKR
eukprot:GFYU01000392.1.p1 GENE.GFYU01000392.1~~GFYU01000392.1.p1  ORF type:complete len:1408 (-),score=377.02 GFYU01000392.1:90-4313(-)